MAIRTLSNQTIDSTLSTAGAITSGGNLRVSSGILYVGNGSNTTARIMGFGDTEMITGVSGATYLRVSGSSTLAGTLQSGQYILAAGLAYGAVNNFTQIIDGGTGAITGTSASFSSSVTAAGNSNSFGNTTIAALSATSGTFSASVTAAGNSNSFGGTTFSNVLTINPGSTTVATETFRRDTAGDAQIIGDINFNTTAAEGTDDRISLIRSRTSGGAATSRGGELLFYTRKSGSADFNLTTYDKDGNWTFSGSVTFTSNIYADRYYADTTTKQTDALFIGRQNGNIVEFGHNNQSGQYYGVLGVQGSSGYPFVGFSCDVDYGANTFTTRGAKGNVIQGSGGNLSFQTVDNTNATGQTPNTRMIIKNGGEVGIGTDSPECKLHIVSTTTDNSKTLLLQNSSTGDASVMFNISGDTYSLGIDNSDGDKFKLSYGALGTNDRLVVDSSGNVGIGLTIPTKKFEVNSGTVSDIVRFGNDAGGMVFGYSSNLASIDLIASQAFRIRQGSTTPLYIKSDGNVGIGVTNPSTKLQVGGIVQVVESSNTAFYGGNYVRMFSDQNYGFRNSGGAYIANISMSGNSYFNGGNVGIGTSSPSYNLEIGGVANPVVAIVSNINSATSSLYFGDSDAKDRGQIRYTHFGDFMELKAGGGTRLYLESGINTAYTPDGLFNANATPSYWSHGNGQFKFGYMDNGSGLYSGAYCFNVKSTDGIPVTGREIGAVYIRDTSNNRMPLIISNQGRININQTNTSYGFGSSTGWLTIANGTGAYNIYNYYTGTDGGSGCARYRLDNTSPSFFDFYYSTTQVGYITTNGTDIFYANTSDYRLKEDLKSFDGMSLLEQIQVYDFKWKESDNRMYGVVAHELQEVVPQAVVGEKDTEKLQAVDYSKLVPVLIKSIQELEARVKELENN